MLSFPNWLLFVTFLWAIAVPQSRASPGFDTMSALHALYLSAGGESWSWRDSHDGPKWNFTREEEGGSYLDNPCGSAGSNESSPLAWQGVICSDPPAVCHNSTCEVVEIRLADYNLIGTIPDDIGNISSLKVVYLYENSLSGVLPTTIGKLSHLERFAAFINSISGTIPNEIVDISNLVVFACGWNRLTGSLPDKITQLSTLQLLHLYRNLITGTIPENIGAMVSLREVALYSNMFSHSIPTSIAELGDLNLIYFYDNLITGTIPSELGSAVSLTTLQLDRNYLHGTIPNELSNLRELDQFTLFRNDISGSIPSGIVNLTSLRHLIMYYNSLTGILPTELSQMVSLEYLYLYENFLSGTIPNGIGSLLEVAHVLLNNNLLTGSLPSEISNIVKAEHLAVFDNMLTGSLPSGIECLVELQNFRVHQNFLTAELPLEWQNLTSLEILGLQDNSFSGPVPSSMGYLASLREMSLDNNNLDGSMPSTLSRLGNLEDMFFQRNALYGTLGNVFNHSLQIRLVNVDISDNRLTGAIDDELFLLPQVKVLALSGNCFRERLRSSMCSASRLEVLSLNGLGSGEQCKHVVNIPLTDVALFNTVEGTLPGCVWSMPSLMVLHLSGNGLSGELHVNSFSSNITDLTLSHNQFTGTVPPDLFSISSVDLSYNQFTGEYAERPEHVSSSNVNFEINRLSGDLPTDQLNKAVNGSISVLRGNMFSCGSLPDHDEHAEDYVCGSKNLNESFYVILAALLLYLLPSCVVLIAAVVAPQQRSGYLRQLHEATVRYRKHFTLVTSLSTAQISSCASLAVIVRMTNSFKEFILFFAKLVGVVLLISASLYLLKINESYLTHSNTYSWFWTLAYLKGILPAVLLFVVWLVAVSLCFAEYMLRPEKGCDTKPAGDSEENTSKLWPSSRKGFAAMCEAVNAIIMISANSLYIYSTQLDMQPTIHLSIQVVFAIFKMLYAKAALPLLSEVYGNPTENVYIRFKMLTVNNMVIPCLATALTSPACFQGLLVLPEPVSTPYFYEICSRYITNAETGEINCVDYESIPATSGTLTPPFVYNHQCASVLLTSYIPIYVLVYSAQLVLPSLAMMLLSWVDYDSIRPAIREHFDGVLWPQYWTSGAAAVLHSNPALLLKTRAILCFDILNNLMMLMTFGMCSPVLTVAIMCVVALRLNVWILIIGRFVAFNTANGNEDVSFDNLSAAQQTCLLALSKNCTSLSEAIRKCFWRLIWCSSVFFALICWDMAADDVGWLLSIWIPLLTVLFPVLIWMISSHVEKNAIRAEERPSSVERNSDDIVLSPLSLDRRE